jgi:4-hydroxy-3-polyprenylbenzoate decarboxylase
VAPPVPPFYVKMESVDEMIRQIAARLVNWAGTDPGDELKRWGEGPVS